MDDALHTARPSRGYAAKPYRRFAHVPVLVRRRALATDWHLVHLGSRAVGGAGLVFTEATAVTARGRISSHDLGIWRDEHVPGLERIARFVAAQGAAPGIQIAHAGRKASVAVPWDGGHPVTEAHGGWKPAAPSPVPFADGYSAPEELSLEGIEDVINCFRCGGQTGP